MSLNLSYKVNGAGQEAVLTATNRPSIIYKHWQLGRFYELPLLAYWNSLGQPDIYIDVGAHVGNHTVWASLAWPGAQIYAFEPDPLCYFFLTENIAENACTNVRAKQLALWSEATVKYLNNAPEEEGMRWVDDRKGIQIQTTKLDTILKGIRKRDIILKIDTESLVGPILSGAKHVLLDNNCRVFAEAKEQKDKDILSSNLAEFGYKLTGKVWGATPMWEAIKES